MTTLFSRLDSRIKHDPPTDPAGGENKNDPPPSDPPQGEPAKKGTGNPPPTSEDFEFTILPERAHEGFKSLLRRYGNNLAVVAELSFKERFEESQRRKKAQEDLQAYTALGSADEIKTRLSELDRLRATETKRQVEDTRRKAADLVDYNFDVLNDRLTTEVISFEKPQGADKEVPHVTYKENGSEVKKPLTEYAEDKFKTYLPILKKGTTQENNRERASRTVIRQRQADGKPSGKPVSVSQQIHDRKYKQRGEKK